MLRPEPEGFPFEPFHNHMFLHRRSRKLTGLGKPALLRILTLYPLLPLGRVDTPAAAVVPPNLSWIRAVGEVTWRSNNLRPRFLAQIE